MMKIEIKKIVNGLLAYGGVELRRKQSRGFDTTFDPTERNHKDTLNKLWSDPAFRRQYLNDHHQQLYTAVTTLLRNEGILERANRVIDVGCGPGFFLSALRDSGYRGELFGCDFSDSAIESARNLCPDAILFTHDIYEPLQGKYDVIICMETLEHLLHPDKALAHLLAAGHTVVLTVPEGRTDSFRGHINFWSKESWGVFVSSVAKPSARPVAVAEINEHKNLIAHIGS